MSDFKLSDDGFRLRFETVVDPFVNIIELVSGQMVNEGAERRRGTIVTIDTIEEREQRDFWGNIKERLAAAHDLSKSLFYGLLTPDTLKSLGPSYD